MRNNKRRSSGLLDQGTRTPGNFEPEEQFDEKALNETQSKNQQRESIKKSFKYQKRSIKISEEQGLVLDAIGKVNNMKYNYEIIQLLLDSYREQTSENDRKKIDRFLEI